MGTRLVVPDLWLASRCNRQLNFQYELEFYKYNQKNPQPGFQKFINLQRYHNCFVVVVDYVPLQKLQDSFIELNKKERLSFLAATIAH